MSDYESHRIDIPQVENGWVKVKDLIEALQKAPQNATILISVMDGGSPSAVKWDTENGLPKWSVLIT